MNFTKESVGDRWCVSKTRFTLRFAKFPHKRIGKSVDDGTVVVEVARDAEQPAAGAGCVPCADDAIHPPATRTSLPIPAALGNMPSVAGSFHAVLLS